MKRLLTKENLHNLHFSATRFFAEDWKNKKMYLRQVFFDTPDIVDTHLALDEETLELYLYVDDFGTKEKPFLYSLGNLSPSYFKAYHEISNCESQIIALLQVGGTNLFRNYLENDKRLNVLLSIGR